ncbi:MAG TPA: type I DNA topoisomerase [Acholeplasmatales bacterium]|nr:type I DNA topoisomerase [Acholeplasmatales bacterium]
MADKLVIVESPSKSKTIEQYLGHDYTVKSSKGHVRDLAIKGAGGLGVDVEHDFKPEYEVIPEKKAVVKELYDASRTAKEIYLATDPDREGEAISWHLLSVIDTKNKLVKRVIFNEITKTAILEAFTHPTDIDEHLVSSQETRRIVDRIMGFKLSKLLQSKIKSKSAGRVQSAALKLIVDREKIVEAFVQEEYYEIYAKFPTFTAQLSKLNGKNVKIDNSEAADRAIASFHRTFAVESRDVRRKNIDAKPAFITSTLQQDASNRLGFTSSKTMQIAQRLYEGIELGAESVGLISYMRTDSVRLSAYFVDHASAYIAAAFGKNYLGSFHKADAKSNVQDAHEAIRPTDPARTPESIRTWLSKDEFNLYQMIYARAIASLMKPTVVEVETLLLDAGTGLFKAVSTKQVFDGYLKIYGKFETEADENAGQLPECLPGDTLAPDAVTAKQCFTQPPQRYNEARLIKEMEDVGIGRPSTYAQTISTLKDRKYVTLVEKKFVPTDQGKITIEQLDIYFHDFIGATYTRDMENILDKIALGEAVQLDVIRDFYAFFEPLYENARINMDKLAPRETGEKCPLCGAPMVFRRSRYGEFEGCVDYPKCKYVKPRPQTGEPKEKAEDTHIRCPKCHKGTLVVRVASKGPNKGNKFYACGNFPKCRFVAPFKAVDRPCPRCGKPLVAEEDGTIRCIDAEKCGFVETK